MLRYKSHSARMMFNASIGTLALGVIAVASPVAAQNAAVATQEPAADEIVVTGIRGSLLRSIEAKRNSDTIIDSISAEELGKFPDRNVADSLGNIPGITVSRGRGAEGQNVTVRGLGQNFSITTLNGRILPTDTQDRAFAFDVLPSEMISGAEVMKAVQASAIEGSIGGGINLRSARPLDNKGLYMSGSIEGEYGDLSEKFGYKASGVISSTFADDTIGALLSVTYSQRNIRTDNLGEYFVTSETEDSQKFDFDNDGTIGNNDQAYIFPNFYSVGTVLGKRKRLGISGALQFKPSDAINITLDGLFTHYNTSTSNYRQSNFLNPRNDPEGDFAAGTPPKWFLGSVKFDANHVITNFSMNDLVAEVLTVDEPRVVDTYQFGGNVEWQQTDALSMTLDAYYARASRNDAGKNRFVVAGIPGASALFATRDGGLPDLQITIPGGRSLSDATDEDYRAHYIGIQGDNLKDTVMGLKIDEKFDTGSTFLKSILFGGSFTERKKSSQTFDNAVIGPGRTASTDCNYCGYPFSFGDIGAQVIRPFPVNGLLGKLPGAFPRTFAAFDIDTYLAALPRADNNPAIIDPATGLPYPAGYSTQIVLLDEPLSFKIDEQTLAGYVQANLEGARWRGDVGLRIVRTKVRSAGSATQIVSITKIPGNTADFNVVVSDPTPVVGGGNYTKFLPSANFAYDLTDDLKLRLAAAKVIARPSFSELSSASDANSAKSGTFIIFNAGNPNLRPTTANQFDASLEYYISSQSAISAAVFYKDIKDFVTVVSSQAVIAGQDFTIEGPANGDSAKVFGVEVAGQYLLNNGLGIQANMTYNRSRAKLGGVKGKLDGAIPFSANAKLFYETDRFNAQISYSYAAQFTARISGLIAGEPEIERAYHELSAGIGFEIISGVKLFAEGSNLLDQATRRYNAYPNVPSFYEASGRSFFFGVRGRI